MWRIGDRRSVEGREGERDEVEDARMRWILGASKKFCSMICLGLRIGFRAGERGSAVAVAVAAALSQTRFEAIAKRLDSKQTLFLSHPWLSVAISVACSMVRGAYVGSVEMAGLLSSSRLRLGFAAATVM